MVIDLNVKIQLKNGWGCSCVGGFGRKSMLQGGG